jgi:hypothetical protein
VCHHAGPLTHLDGESRNQSTVDPARPGHRQPPWGGTEMVPVFAVVSLDGGGPLLCPSDLAGGYPAALTVASRQPNPGPPRSSPRPRSGAGAHRVRPISARFGVGYILRGARTQVPPALLSIPLPGANHLAALARRRRPHRLCRAAHRRVLGRTPRPARRSPHRPRSAGPTKGRHPRERIDPVEHLFQIRS